MQLCAYLECGNHRTDKNVEFFPFPILNKNQCNKWVENCGNKTLQSFLQNDSYGSLRNYAICKKHFKVRDFLSKNVLKSGAVPIPEQSVFVPSIHEGFEDFSFARSFDENHVVDSQGIALDHIATKNFDEDETTPRDSFGEDVEKLYRVLERDCVGQTCRVCFMTKYVFDTDLSMFDGKKVIGVINASLSEECKDSIDKICLSCLKHAVHVYLTTKQCRKAYQLLEPLKSELPRICSIYGISPSEFKFNFRIYLVQHVLIVHMTTEKAVRIYKVEDARLVHESTVAMKEWMIGCNLQSEEDPQDGKDDVAKETCRTCFQTKFVLTTQYSFYNEKSLCDIINTFGITKCNSIINKICLHCLQKVVNTQLVIDRWKDCCEVLKPMKAYLAEVTRITGVAKFDFRLLVRIYKKQTDLRPVLYTAISHSTRMKRPHPPGGSTTLISEVSVEVKSWILSSGQNAPSKIWSVDDKPSPIRLISDKQPYKKRMKFTIGNACEYNVIMHPRNQAPSFKSRTESSSKGRSLLKKSQDMSILRNALSSIEQPSPKKKRMFITDISDTQRIVTIKSEEKQAEGKIILVKRSGPASAVVKHPSPPKITSRKKVIEYNRSKNAVDNVVKQKFEHIEVLSDEYLSNCIQSEVVDLLNISESGDKAPAIRFPRIVKKEHFFETENYSDEFVVFDTPTKVAPFTLGNIPKLVHKGSLRNKSVDPLEHTDSENPIISNDLDETACVKHEYAIPCSESEAIPEFYVEPLNIPTSDVNPIEQCLVATELNSSFIDEAQRCEKCQKLFESGDEYWEHVTLELCDKVQYKESELEEHRKQHRRALKSFICPLCDELVRVDHRVSHMVTHGEDKPYWCDQCNFKCAWPGNLSRHKLTHSGDKPFPCPQCDFAAIQKTALATHVKQHEKLSEPLVCRRCDSVHDNLHDFKDHMKIHNVQRVNFRVLALNSDAIACQVCGKTYATAGGLAAHMRIHDKNNDAWCVFCQKGFISNAVYRIHMRIHTGEKPYACPYCPKRFTQKPHLKTHVASHENKRAYRCDFCPMTFNIKLTLDEHRRIHTGETLDCQFCSRQFRHFSNMRKHIRESHPETVISRYGTCNVKVGENDDNVAAEEDPADVSKEESLAENTDNDQ